MNRFALPGLVLVGAVTLGACSDSPMDPVAASLSMEEPFQSPSAASQRAPAPGDNSIAAIAIDAGFSELVGALSYVDAELNAGLVELFLNGRDQYTVFAPTNQAFENLYVLLGIGGISDLPAELVRDVLFYHVTEGRRAANSVVPRNGTRSITTLLGAKFTVDKMGMITDVFGQSASIVSADISASNGIIHVIDTVILPLES